MPRQQQETTPDKTSKHTITKNKHKKKDSDGNKNKNANRRGHKAQMR